MICTVTIVSLSKCMKLMKVQEYSMWKLPIARACFGSYLQTSFNLLCGANTQQRDKLRC